MIRTIVKDTVFLSQKGEIATKEDTYLARDLQDTLSANRDKCVGMAANMIGVNKRVIIVSLGFVDLVMFNPILTAKSQPYQTEESCLSLQGSRPAKRFKEITVQYLDSNWMPKTLTLKDFPAQIVQHELDHLEGILI